MRRMNVVNRKQALKVVKEMDAFPKVPESYKEQTASGGGISILVFIFIGILVYYEVQYYTDTELKYEYNVDTDFTGKLDINIDMTVAMKCDLIGADILDLTGQSTESFGRLQEEAVVFDLTSEQLSYLHMIQQINNYIKNEYHAIHDFLWKSGYTGMATAMPPRKKVDDQAVADGCRLYGTLTVNKVAGNFHITAGKSVPVFPRGHAHLAIMLSVKDYNFSHRIDHFSFGKSTPGVVNPMDGDFSVTHDHNHMFQYFIQVVPTRVHTRQARVDTFQFAVTDRNRTINHSKGSHGVPGIFVKYDLAPMKVSVREEHKPYWQFLVRLCGIIGGVFATSGMLRGLANYLVDIISARFKIGFYKAKTGLQTEAPPTYPSPLQDGALPNSEPEARTEENSNNFVYNNSGASLIDAAPSTSWQQPLLVKDDSS